MDGDEERPGAIAVREDDPGAGAEASGDAAPAPAAEPAERTDGAVEGGAVEGGAVEGGADGAPPDGVVADGVPADGVPADGVPADGVAADDADADGVPASDEVAAAQAPPAPRRRPCLRRGVTVLVAAGVVALGVSAFSWIAPSAEAADQRFVDAVHDGGHVVAPGSRALVVSAARKICDRRYLHDSDLQRRPTALTSDEIAAVGAAFGADVRSFTTLALETYCSS